MRNTIQKQKIIDYLRKQQLPKKAEDIYKAVKRSISSISLSTVYRNLNNLSAERQIAKIELNNEYHFDADTCGKVYLVCKYCGSIDVQRHSLDHLAEQIGEFQPECIQVISYGKCKKCEGGIKNGN